MDADGSHKHQVTHNGAANFAPYFLPDGKRIIFASNMADPTSGRAFDLYMINEDGTGLERITTYPGFRRVSHVHLRRQASGVGLQPQRQEPHETNIFIADWVD